MSLEAEQIWKNKKFRKKFVVFSIHTGFFCRKWVLT